METIHRDSINLVEEYVKDDLEEFMSVEKYRLLQSEANSIFVCTNNQTHIGVGSLGMEMKCTECGADVRTIKRIK